MPHEIHNLNIEKNLDGPVGLWGWVVFLLGTNKGKRLTTSQSRATDFNLEDRASIDHVLIAELDYLWRRSNNVFDAASSESFAALTGSAYD